MSTPNLPHLHLLCMEDQHLSAFHRALSHLWPTSGTKLTITTHNHALSQLPASVKFDLIVSPANSYARLDGAFDDAISRTFCPKTDYHALTRAAQKVLYEEWRGFAPPGTCTIVPFPEELKTENIGLESNSHTPPLTRNVWGCKFVAICPTMRTPDNVTWDREVVYECVWSLMVQVEKWNRLQQQDPCQRRDEQMQKGERDRIEAILITPLATGIGKVSPERWAAQFVLALKHFLDAVERPERWSQLDWGQIVQEGNEVEKTWKM